jgi:vacuolar-type H+-ATPase subunit I/STV1
MPHQVLVGGIEAALIFGNILSYARLYGIALASVILATVANQPLPFAKS